MNSVFKLNLPGLNAIMKSSEMAALLNRAANNILAVAGENYEIVPAHTVSFVGIASVRTANPDGMRDNARNNTLVKAKGSVSI